jgi:multiple sugar transport system permease protein
MTTEALRPPRTGRATTGATASRPITRRSKFKFSKAAIYAAIGFWLLATLGPYVIMLLTSLTPQSELLKPAVNPIPQNPTFEAYGELFRSTPFLSYMTNSAITSIGTVIFSLLAAMTAAICLSRFRFRGRTTMLTGLLIAQLFPAVLLVIPLQAELRVMGLLDSHWGLILVYSTFATPFATFLLKNFLDGLPRELDEAATIDGCSPFQTVRYVLFPLLRPGLTAAGTYIFIFAWNELLYALTFTSSPAAQTIPVGLQLFIGEYQIRWDLLTAGGVLAAIPVLVGFMLVQRQLISGLTSGAVKG